MKKIIKKGWWIDPPEGSMYGFPKTAPYDISIDALGQWMLENGCPQELADNYGKFFVGGTTITMTD